MRINYFKFSIMEREVAGGGGACVCAGEGRQSVKRRASRSVGKAKRASVMDEVLRSCVIFHKH